MKNTSNVSRLLATALQSRTRVNALLPYTCNMKRSTNHFGCVCVVRVVRPFIWQQINCDLQYNRLKLEEGVSSGMEILQRFYPRIVHIINIISHQLCCYVIDGFYPSRPIFINKECIRMYTQLHVPQCTPQTKPEKALMEVRRTFFLCTSRWLENRQRRAYWVWCN